MPCKRPRSTNKCSWTVGELKAAILAVRDGKQLKEVTRKL